MLSIYQDSFFKPFIRPFKPNSRVFILDSLKSEQIPLERDVSTHLFLSWKLWVLISMDSKNCLDNLFEIFCCIEINSSLATICLFLKSFKLRRFMYLFDLWWNLGDLNSWYLACKANVLPTKLKSLKKSNEFNLHLLLLL